MKKARWPDVTIDKYNVSMFRDDDYCGKFTFYVSDRYKPPEIIFSGMYLEPQYRSHGLSKTVMDELQHIADSDGRAFDHACPQRKPLTCLILQKHGFTPYENDVNEYTNLCNTVYVIGQPQNTLPQPAESQFKPVYVHFPLKHRAREFENSSICKSQPYIVLPEIKDIRNAVRCVLNVDYLK